MENTQNRKRGRMPIPEELRKKNINCTMKIKTIKKLKKDAEAGKAQTPNQMITKIVERYYKKRDKEIIK